MSLYYRDARAVILVYDVSDLESLENLEYWVKELKEKADPDEMVYAILANKTDIPLSKQKVTSF